MGDFLFGEAVEQVQLAEGVTPDEAKLVLNQEHRKLVVRARLRRRRTALTSTDADLRIWDLPEDFVDVISVYLEDADNEITFDNYEHVPEETMRGIRAGRITRTDNSANGIYARFIGDDNVKHIEIFPAATATDTLYAVIATRPETLETNDAPFECPDESVDVLIDCAIARIGRRHDDKISEAGAVLPEMEAEIARLTALGDAEFGSDYGVFPIIGVDL